VLLNGTLLESETSGGNCSGFISDNGYNISDDGSCELGSTSLVELDDSLIPPLQNNGGPTQTIAIPFGSTPSGFIPIADCIKAVSPPSALTTDQRGAPRPTPGNQNFCDAGAYQTQFSIVTNINDSGPGSLRQAILDANTMPTFADAIAIEAAGIIGLTSGALPSIANTSPQGLEIAAIPGVIVSGRKSSGIFSVNAGATLTLGFLTIATGSATDGGGIMNLGTVTVEGCTIAENSASVDGGGIYNEGTMTIVNSTFFDNSASEGGGIDNDNDGTLTVTNSTFSGKSASTEKEGGGINNRGHATVKGTILGNESTGGNCAHVTDGGYNISDDVSCLFGGTSINNSETLNLDPSGLQNNGGSTETIALEAGSEATDFIPIAACTDQESPPQPLTSDQRDDPGPTAAIPTFATPAPTKA
jgi:predicted outer membrane repeat protein